MGLASIGKSAEKTLSDHSGTVSAVGDAANFANTAHNLVGGSGSSGESGGSSAAQTKSQEEEQQQSSAQQFMLQQSSSGALQDAGGNSG